MRAARDKLDEQDEQDVPPTVACTVCGRADCTGCSEPQRASASVLPWEDSSRPFWQRLFATAEHCALRPEQAFGQLDGGQLGSSFRFALTCEAIALASIGLLALLLLGALAPQLLRSLLSSPWARLLLVTGFLVCTLGMLLVHVLWGFCMEFGAGLFGGRPDHARGFRFGMYSTGWDLLTSPAGLLLSLAFRGRRGFLAPLRAATRVARPAVDAYLLECRAFDARARKGAFRVTLLAFGGAFGLLLAACTIGMIYWVRAELGG